MKEEKKINLLMQNKPRYSVPLFYWEEMVLEIIDSKCKNSIKIELNFDELLPHLSNERIRHLYIQLLEYYKKIDAEGAAYYWELFDADLNNDADFILEDIVLEDFDGEDFFYD